MFEFARDSEMGGRIAFVESYNEQLGQYMVHGVDAWLNNPVPPMEASGTSGMKAAVNGVPHVSLLDGWWLEGYNGNNGWRFVSEDSADANPERDREDAGQLYALLEEEMIPMYYQAAEDGTPRDWMRYMKESIKSCAPFFSARRMVKEYYRKYYAQVLE